VRWSGDRQIAELNIFAGVPDVVAGVDAGPEGTTVATEVNGVPAFATALAGTSAVAWERTGGVTVRVGLFGPLDEAIAIARSIRPVDSATWEAVTRFRRPPYDGCESMFC
jgi:hypothetical protein